MGECLLPGGKLLGLYSPLYSSPAELYCRQATQDLLVPGDAWHGQWLRAMAIHQQNEDGTSVPPHSIILSSKWDPIYKLLSTFYILPERYLLVILMSEVYFSELNTIYCFHALLPILCKIFKKGSQNSLGGYVNSQMMWVSFYRQACFSFFLFC